VTSAAHGVGDKVLALWGYKWYPGVVDEVLEGGYKVAWDDGDEGEVPAAHVRAEKLAVDVPAARDASPPAVVTPRAAPPMSPARSPLAAPSRDAPCGTTPSFNADAALRGGRCRSYPCGGKCPTEPSFNADVVKRLACGRTALACCASNGEIPDRYVKLDIIVLASAKAEAAWDSLTALKRRRARKIELAGEWMIDHGVRKLYLHRECYRVFENLRLQGPLASVTVIDTNPAPAVDVAP